jgi:oligogalacturonide transporter
MSASSVSIYAILSDMADVDELITSISRPGTCSGMATFIRKIATGFSSALIGVLLAFAGYNEVIANEGARQSAATQQGIALIYVFAPIVLMVLTLFFAVRFPMGKKEFEIVKRDIARRKGEVAEPATEEEKKVCEKITGFSYASLWDERNALQFKNRRE